MVTLMVFSTLLFLNFFIFVLIATWYVTPKIRVTKMSNKLLARQEPKIPTWQFDNICDAKNNYAIRGTFE